MNLVKSLAIFFFDLLKNTIAGLVNKEIQNRFNP